jgi:hypothetical protein
LSFSSFREVGLRPSASKRACSASRSVHGEREVPVAVAQKVRLRAAVIDRQLEFELALGIAQIEQREAFECQALRYCEAKGLFVERKGALLVENPDHGMNGFSHGIPLCFGRLL